MLERSIRTYQEVCRSLHLQAGFACHPPLWQVTCEYVAISLSRDKWHTAFGKEWKRPDYILGQLVFYRTKFQEKFKLSPNASPGLFGGWKIEFGFRYQGACKIIDYESLKKGKLSVMLVPDREIYVREDIVFPLCELAEKAFLLTQMLGTLVILTLCQFLLLKTCQRFNQNPKESTSPIVAFLKLAALLVVVVVKVIHPIITALV